MDRRNFLCAAAGTAGVCVLPSCSGGTPEVTGVTAPSVLVIGAGIAGLAAANELRKKNHPVTVLEARADRYGGRLWTTDNWRTDPATHVTAAQNIPLDMGASWIHGIHNNPLKSLAGALNPPPLMSSTFYENSVTYGGDGALLTSVQTKRLEGLQAAMDAAVENGQDAENDAPLYETVWKYTQARSKSAEEQALLRFLMSSQYETEYGGTVSGVGLGAERKVSNQTQELSTWWFDDEGKNRLNIAGDDQIFVKGFSQIADHLAKGLTIKMGEVVSHIEHSGKQVIVTTNKGVHTADRVIVTVPLGVLKKGAIGFTPALPPEHTLAIQQIGMGVLNKLYLKFDTAFWASGGAVTEKTHWIESIPPATEITQSWTEWVNFKGLLKDAQGEGVNVLLAFSAADDAIQSEQLSDRDIINSAMNRLKLIYGSAAKAPTAFLRTRWHQDPHTLGSYSFNAVGMAQDARAKLAAPINHKLYFAGEATDSDYYGTVHGAYLSGLDTAKKISG